MIIAVTFWQGVRRGMDHAIAVGPESDQTAISIALSETVYGLDLGYVGHAAVLNALRSAWNRGVSSPDDATILKNSNDRTVLNEAIAAASALPPIQTGYFSDRSLISGVYDDLGYVDFIKAAFAVFGRNVEALYRLYFAILALSAFCLLVSFRDRLMPQVVLLLTLFGVFIELHTNLFHHQMPSFTGLRHSSTLAILPAWHLAFTLIYHRRLTVPNVVAALVQLLVLVMAIRIRGAAAWVPLFLVALGAVLGWWHARGPRLAAIAGGIGRWPVVLMVGVIGLQALQFRMALHPIYFTDDVIPHHGLWHSAYLGLAGDPAILPPYVQDFIAKGGYGDAIGAAGAMEFVERSRFIKVQNWDLSELPPSYLSPWTGTVKFGLHDKIMRRAFFEAVLNHPGRTVWLFLVGKPVKLAWIFVVYVFTPAFFGLMLLATAGAYLATGPLFAARDAVGETLLAGGLAALFSLLPSFVAYPIPWGVVDSLLVLSAVVPLAIATAIFRIWPALSRRFKSNP
jgi:hypothetical protein